VIVGPGSISFEMIRYLTEQFPILVGPPWLENLVQPIDIRDEIAYLIAALEDSPGTSRIFEIGGSEVMTYSETMLRYARMRGLKRWRLTLPWVPIRWMALIIDRLTPVPASIAAPLIDGLRSSSIVRDDSARQAFPKIIPSSYQEAVEHAIRQLSPVTIDPAWEIEANGVKIHKRDGFLIDHRQLLIPASSAAVFRVVLHLGGLHGWLYLDCLWQLRGKFDRWVGGPGMRGRPQLDRLAVGDVLDFYRVEALIPGRLLRLHAELKAPGQGWMEWRVEAHDGDGSILVQNAYFAPKGTIGFLYWYILYPVHRLVFAGLLKRLAQLAVRENAPQG
jgi:hypothetical protein